MSSQVLFSSVPSSTPLSSLHPSPAQTFAPLPETSRPASPTPSCLHKPSLEKPDLQALPPSTSSHPDHPLHHPSYTGDGTPGSPYVVSWHEHDEGNPREWRDLKRWAISLMGSLEMLVVTFGTSAYTGGYRGLAADFGSSKELSTGGMSMYVIGLGLGGLIFAPASELSGRKLVFILTMAAFTLFGLGVTLAQNMATILLCRFFMGFFGCSVLSNAPGMLSDVWAPSEISLPMTINSVTPFLGPIFGPIIGGFISQYAGPHSWRWIQATITIFSAVVTIVGAITVPETYPLTILRRRCAILSKETGLSYVTVFEAGRPKRSTVEVLKTGLSRPFIFLFLEPIVIALSLYCALVFGILYLFFAAYPIMFVEQRGWTQGKGALPFLGLALGLFIGVPISRYTTGLYRKAALASPTGRAPPEARLYFAIISAALLPLSLIIMAWTSPPTVHWSASTIAGIPFGIGILGMMTSVMGYLADTYTIYSASVFAANSLFRYIAGAVFPLFAVQMFHGMGAPWALTLLAIVALACAPMPWVFFKYGPRIRALSKHVPPSPPHPPSLSTRTASSSSVKTLANEPSPPADFSTAIGEEAVRVQEMQDGILPDEKRLQEREANLKEKDLEGQ